MIEVKNLVKQYGDHIAIKDLSFTIDKGKIYGLLGTNGAGKSTTMNIMTGYIGATSGEVFIDGHNILEEPEAAKKKIGYLPEMPPLYMDMTVGEYLTFAAELKKVSKKEVDKNVREAMRITKIEDVEKRLIRNLSKGYKQRVGLAQALLGSPEIIILDEPTVGLDPLQIIEIRDLIRSLAENHTVLLSSHILSEVSAICDHVMIISKGRLVASDSPEDLEKLMSGHDTLQIRVKGTEERATGILSEIDHILSTSYEQSSEENAVEIQIQAEDDIDLREEIFYAFAKNNCPILQMQSSKVSLEDVFLELTNDLPKDSSENDGNETKEYEGTSDSSEESNETEETLDADEISEQENEVQTRDDLKETLEEDGRKDE